MSQKQRKMEIEDLVMRSKRQNKV